MSLISKRHPRVSPPQTPFGLYFALTKGSVQPHKFWNSRNFRFKFFIRSIFMPVKTYQILNFITKHSAYNDLLQNQPRLPCRVHRPYLSTALSVTEKAEAILYHYKEIMQLLGEDRFRQHIGPEGLCLSRFAGKDGQFFTLQLVSTYRLDKEGEASIILRNSCGQMLAEITFVLCIRNKKRSLIIGGLQGPNGENTQRLVQQATKNLYSLFPKRLVLESLVQTAELFNIKSMIAVSNQLHVYQSVRYKNRIKHMHADYNSFWEMSGGILCEDGFYSIPLNIVRKSLEDVPSKKRAEYRRRYELIDVVRSQTFLTLTRKIS
ncbi:hypothetical protein HA49_15215 [Tatumella morbirosei]|uniref:Virulence factor VirK n=1 Tax=Tatumella morbirosei TaxID=642227 RepID=A0A095UCH4_9GAMM|nr:VirK/YbjX family protein [Tatumella morbirosei]KGD72118.1 hypothetical protein HA49_15215 [Tatumella morbirosei]